MAQKYEFAPKGVCTTKISFRLDDDGIVTDLHFAGGCQGNLKALGIILEGNKATDIIDKLSGNTCGNRPTSCMDQLTRALTLALKQKGE